MIIGIVAAVALAGAGLPVAAEPPDAVAKRYGLAGEVLIAEGNRILLDRGYGPVAPGGTARHRAGKRWRLASITKQVTAALLVRDHLLMLDQPFPALPALTLRQLLTHHSGLANPDATPQTGAGVPGFYTRPPDLAYCRSQPPRPNSRFSYNNCDYLLAATLLGDRPAWPSGLRMATGTDRGVPGFVHAKPEPRFRLDSFGAAGGLLGAARALFRFDRALLAGSLLPAPALAALWTAEGQGSAQALGQWVFTAPLACVGPTRIVQRDGEIFGVQTRNFILPERNVTVILFTNRSADDFALGEVWEGKGFVYDLLSAAACATGHADGMARG